MVHIKKIFKKKEKVKKSARGTKSQNSLNSHLKLCKEEENKIFFKCGKKKYQF